MKNIILSTSLILNIALIGAVMFLFAKALNGCAEISDGRIGVLNKNLEIGYFDKNKKLFTLPKGLVVKEASATGAGWFEPNRFRLIITSNDENLVNYENINIKKLPNENEFYSADINVKNKQ